MNIFALAEPVFDNFSHNLQISSFNLIQIKYFYEVIYIRRLSLKLSLNGQERAYEMSLCEDMLEEVESALIIISNFLVGVLKLPNNKDLIELVFEFIKEQKNQIKEADFNIESIEFKNWFDATIDMYKEQI